MQIINGNNMPPNTKSEGAEWEREFESHFDWLLDDTNDEIKTFIAHQRQQAVAEFAREVVAKRYTFKEVDWGDGIKTQEPVEDETKSLRYCEGYNQALDDIRTIAKERGIEI